jgi:hypothetical protein
MAKYSKTLLVYLDVMGFQESIKKDSVDAITERIAILKQQATVGLSFSSPWIMDAPKAQMRNFSDLVVRARPIITDEDDLIMWVNYTAPALFESWNSCAWRNVLG